VYLFRHARSDGLLALAGGQTLQSRTASARFADGPVHQMPIFPGCSPVFQHLKFQIPLKAGLYPGSLSFVKAKVQHLAFYTEIRSTYVICIIITTY